MRTIEKDMKKGIIKTELQMLREINDLSQIPKISSLVIQDGFVRPPDNVIDYLDQLKVHLELLPDGTMPEVDFYQLLNKVGLPLPVCKINRIIIK